MKFVLLWKVLWKIELGLVVFFFLIIKVFQMYQSSVCHPTENTSEYHLPATANKQTVPGRPAALMVQCLLTAWPSSGTLHGDSTVFSIIFSYRNNSVPNYLDWRATGKRNSELLTEMREKKAELLFSTALQSGACKCGTCSSKCVLHANTSDYVTVTVVAAFCTGAATHQSLSRTGDRTRVCRLSVLRSIQRTTDMT